MTKGITLTLNDEYLETLVKQLNLMKQDKNKMIRLYSADKTIVVVFKHKDAKRKTE